MQNNKVIVVALLFSALLLGLGSGIYVTLSSGDQLAGNSVDRANFLKGGGFRLNDINGEVSLSDFSGRPVILYFGYTFCPDVCPTGLAVLREVLTHYDNNNIKKSDTPSVLFITLDPERDTPARMHEYAAFFSPDIIGLSGTPESVSELLSRYGVYSRKVSNDAQPESYTLDHSAGFFIVDRTGALITVLPHFSLPVEIVKAVSDL